jgi:hypothetical protein
MSDTKKEVHFMKIDWCKWITITIVAICVIVFIYRPIDKVTNQRQVTATVTDKAVKNTDG